MINPYTKGSYTRNLFERSGFDSEHLYHEFMAIVEPAIRDKMIYGLLWLDENNIDAVLVGGAAVIHYLSANRSLTPDLDFLVRDLEKVKNLLESQNISYSPLIQSNGGDPIGITVGQFNLDLLDVNECNSRLNRYVMETSDKALVASVSLRIINPEALIILKFELGRDKDDDDAFALLKSGRLNKERYFKAIRDLRPCLKPSVDIISYGNLIR